MTYPIPEYCDIFIPSRDRVHTLHTWGSLDDLSQKRATIVCPEEEVEKHVKKGRRAIARPPGRLSAVRQWIVDSRIEMGLGDIPVLMLDDDLGFFVRKEQAAWNLRACDLESNEVHKLFSHMETLVGGKVVHAGLSPRQMNNKHWPARVIYDTRMNAVHCVLPDALKFYGVRYDDVDMMEDYHVTLSLFRKGERNAQVVWGAWDQKMGSGASGGFSHFRTKETQAEAAHKLAGLHPRFVQVVKKTPKTGSGDFAGERTDVLVQWKESSQAGQLNNPKPDFRRD